MRVAVDKSEIADSVIQLSEYIGEKGGDYEKVRAIKYDKPLLEKYIMQALTEVGNVLDRLVVETVANGDEYGLELSGTVCRPAEVEQSIVRYATASVMSHWLTMVYPEAVPSYEADREREKIELAKLSYYRQMPR